MLNNCQLFPMLLYKWNTDINVSFSRNNFFLDGSICFDGGQGFKKNSWRRGRLEGGTLLSVHNWSTEEKRVVEIKLHYEDLNKHSILQLYKAARHYLDKNSDWLWIGGGEIRGALFFKEKAFFDQYRMLA